MRIYNKWYEEIWFLIQENKDLCVHGLIGFLLVLACVLSYIYFNGA